jgi:hypothetical protein
MTRRCLLGPALLSAALAVAGPGLSQVRYAAPSAAAGAWSDQPPPDKEDCGPIVLSLPAVAGVGTTPVRVQANLQVPACRMNYAASFDSTRAPTTWLGEIGVRSGRTLVALRPGAAPGSPRPSDSLTLWLSIDGCRLSGVRKVSGVAEVAIFRKAGCVDAAAPKKGRP